MEISNETIFQGKPHRFTFYPTDSFENYAPITQAWAFCFHNDKLIVGKAPNGTHNLPGGTVEQGENPVQTLHRELDEEISATAIAYKLLGVQKVEELDTNKTYYQLRFVCKVKLNELTPDPCFDECWERIEINPEDFLKYFPWGPIGEHLIKEAQAVVKTL